MTKFPLIHGLRLLSLICCFPSALPDAMLDIVVKCEQVDFTGKLHELNFLCTVLLFSFFGFLFFSVLIVNHLATSKGCYVNMTSTNWFNNIQLLNLVKI